MSSLSGSQAPDSAAVASSHPKSCSLCLHVPPFYLCVSQPLETRWQAWRLKTCCFQGQGHGSLSIEHHCIWFQFLSLLFLSPESRFRERKEHSFGVGEANWKIPEELSFRDVIVLFFPDAMSLSLMRASGFSSAVLSKQNEER